MHRVLPALLALILSAHGSGACAQGIEGVLVERYHASAGQRPDAAPLITYRIYLDLATGHELVSVFGEKGRNLFFSTTTRFFNDTLNGAGSGELIDPGQLRAFPAALDSWLALGFATDRHKGVPLHLDTDGSLLAPSKKRYKKPWYGPELHAADGLMPAARVPEVLKLYLTTSFLEKLSGSLIETEVGAYGVRGTVKGATEENMVLIAQLTTDGELSYAINAAVKAPDGTITKHLAYAAAAADEVELPALRRGSAF